MKKRVKNHKSRLTAGRLGAIVWVSDVEVRCKQRQLATVKAANSRTYTFAVSLYLSLPGALRRGVTVCTSSTPAGSFCTGCGRLGSACGKSSRASLFIRG